MPERSPSAKAQLVHEGRPIVGGLHNGTPGVGVLDETLEARVIGAWNVEAAFCVPSEVGAHVRQQQGGQGPVPKLAGMI